METTTQRIDRRTAEHSSLTPAERTRRAKLAANVRWSRQSGHDGTQAARAAFMARFEREVDPDGRLDPVERGRRAEAAKRAYFQRLALARHKRTTTED